jgi:hypothetical protein
VVKTNKSKEFSSNARIDENDKLVQLTNAIEMQIASFAAKGSVIVLAVITDYTKRAKIWQKKIAGNSTRLEGMTLMAQYIVG